MAKIDEYIPIVGQAVIDDLKLLSEKLNGKVIQNVNSTSVGGGVAEILNRMIPLLREIGVNAEWDVIDGNPEFFDVTKKFHNALHGSKVNIIQKDFETFLATSEENIKKMEIKGDIVFIHDPQPIALVKKKNDNKWIWRCHIDVSNPEQSVWNFLMQFIVNYDSSVFSAPVFSQKLPIRQFMISPSIDPLSDKNKELPQDVIDKVVEKYNIPTDKPIITQISRFDRLKDPVGVIDAYRQVKRHIDCRLILAGGTATDDPEGLQVLEEVQNRADGDKDILILLLPQDDIVINAIQRISTVILQKSIKEGFGLTVSEALWKAKPVVASNVGGIPLQIKHKHTGMLCHSIEGAAFALKQILNSPELAKRLGENGKEHVRHNFLLTRHMKEYMLLFLSLYCNDDIVRL
ncbi:MAG: glycosyltransferase [Candidatus Schekmanbacteria bacterium]|nr:MAG: glycosyltransferase [Candidatus Schekmanbacteria bacterium]